ncbi:class I SAM-dependent RNA methyltransferase, partial [Chlamydiota bacterium]
SQARSGERFLGLMKSRGRVENLSECHLTDSWFPEALCMVRQWWQGTPLNAYHPPTNQGHLRTLTLREGRHTGEKMAVLTVSQEEIDERFLADFADTLPHVDALILRVQIIQKKRPTRFEERILRGKDHIHELLHDSEGRSYRFRIKAASFFQPNTLQAETIYQEAIALADLSPSEEILDLYCGTGSLGIFASPYVSNVLGIEIVPEAVEDAHVNMTLNTISNMQVLAGDVGELLANVACRPSTVIVDPPRVGLGAATIAHLLHLKPEKIVYVSCNPISQAADCAALGYDIVLLQPIDQFPHTPHVENLALLRRRG